MKKQGYSKWSCNERGKAIYTLSGVDTRRWYQRDIDQITHSIGFRKLQRKSQLLSEKDPRSRSRLIHTIEVSRIAMEISERLSLNKELTEAISLGHDIGTSPYGCIGNKFLQNKVDSDFSHELVGKEMLTWIARKEIIDDNDYKASKIQAVLDENKDSIVEESDNRYFSLKVSRCTDEKGDRYFIHHISPEILDGVFNHGDKGEPGTLEGQVVKFADNIAYISQDIEDLLSAGIMQKRNFIGNAQKKLVFESKKGEKITKTWEDINTFTKDSPLNSAFSETRGKRIAAFVNRFVEYNLNLLKDENKLEFYKSDVLDIDIPRLQCDEGLSFVIDYLWEHIESYYNNNLIKTSNEIQITKMMQLWDILDDSKIKCYRNFIKERSNYTQFSKYDNNWKKAFFISNLSWQEIDLIIESYHERNYNFDLDLD
ncbi:MAG: HD domain-containing protein [Clostridia bacterium]|nr:HD domain-containing protein [Clostridia bacterium]